MMGDCGRQGTAVSQKRKFFAKHMQPEVLFGAIYNFWQLYDFKVVLQVIHL